MGARHMTLSDFYADQGFGLVGGRGVVAYPEFPSHNVRLQQLYTFTSPDGPDVAVIVGQLDLARVYQEQGQHLQVAEALSNADTLLNRALTKYAPGGRRWVITLLVALAVVAVIWAMRRGAARGGITRNRPPRRRRRALPRPAPAEDDADDDEADDDNADDPGDDEDAHA